MFRSLSDFSRAWQGERESTLKIMRTLTDTSLSQKVSPEGRTLGRLAWHIVQTLGEMGGHAGLVVDAPSQHTLQPTTAQAIAAAYEAGSAALDTAVKTAWTEADLSGEIDMYGEKWTRGQSLAALIAHEVHHRGQMTILMRQAGLKVPGVYGPAREEWAAYNVPAQD